MTPASATGSPSATGRGAFDVDGAELAWSRTVAFLELA
jgi:hypothetical protein